MAGGDRVFSRLLTVLPRLVFIGGFGAMAALCAVLLVGMVNKSGWVPSSGQAENQAIDMRARSAALGPLKAAYRAAPDSAAQLKLLKGLYAVGDYNGVLRFAREPHAPADERALFRARALFAQGKYRQAANVADRLSANPQARPSAVLLAAQGAYALGDDAAALQGVRRLLQANASLNGAVWALRARLALDSNDLAVARSSVKRALENGYAPFRAEAFTIEAALREGDVEAAQRLLKTRHAEFSDQQRKGQNTQRKDSAGIQLTAMLRLNEGAPLEAQRLLSGGASTGAGAGTGALRGVLLRVLANHQAGDHRQARALLERRLNQAPKDWAALDLGVYLAAQDGDEIRMEALRDRLAAQNELLAGFRRFQLASLKGDYNAAYEAVLAAYAPPNFVPNTGLSFILGPKTDDFHQFKTFLSLADGRYSERIQQGLSAPFSATQNLKEPVALSLISAVLQSEDFLRQGRAGDAAALLNSVLERAPAFKHALLLRTLSDVALGQTDAAQKRLTHYLQENSADIDARLWRARVLTVSDQHAEAINQLKNNINDFLNRPQAVQFYVSLLMRADEPQAQQALRKGAMKDMADGAFKARLLAFLGDLEAAVAVSRRLLFADPAAPGRAAAYGGYMQRLGKDKEALSLLRVILQRNPAANDVLTEIERLQSGAPAPAALREPLDLIESEGPRDSQDQIVFHFVPADGAVAELKARQRINQGEDAGAFLRTACFWGRLHACGEGAQF